MEEFRITLAAARVNAGMTQDDVSKALKIGKNTMVNWESYKTVPSVKQAEALCELYGLSYNQIKWS